MPIDNQLRDSASPGELTTHANTVEASRESFSLLTINGGSSSIRFALYEKGEPLRRLLDGKVDRVGLSGTKLTFKDSTGPQDSRAIDTGDHRSAVAFLLDWLETQQLFASVTAVGHRVVHGMTHTEPERVTPELLDELDRITPYDPEHLPLEIELIEHSANAILHCLRWSALTPHFTAPCRGSPVCCRFRDATRRRAFAVMASTVCLMSS